MLSRTIHAYTIDMQVALVHDAVSLRVRHGLSGALGRLSMAAWAEAIFGRVVDAVVTFPLLVLVIAIVAVLGPGLGNMYIAVGNT